MAHDIVLTVHFWLSALMSLAGFAAILLRKGSGPHRLAGNLFFGFVPVSIVTGAVLIAMNPDKLLQGWVAAPSVYLAVTGWAAARCWDGLGRPFTLIGAALGALVAAAGVPFVIQDLAKPSGGPGGVVFLAVIAALMLAFTLLDVRTILKRGLVGPQRTARHLWRMGLALIIISASTLTAATTYYPKLMSLQLYIPSFLAIALTLFWLTRTLLRTRPGGRIVRAEHG